MSFYSSQVPVGTVFAFTYPQPFSKRGDQLFKVLERESAPPTTRETVVACDKDGVTKIGAKKHKVTLEFVDPMQ